MFLEAREGNSPFFDRIRNDNNDIEDALNLMGCLAVKQNCSFMNMLHHEGRR